MKRLDLGLSEPPWIVGHRGVAGEAPENTLDSFELAIAQGADMVELDLQLTADGRLVVCHDWDLARLGDSDLVIETSGYSALAEVEISGPFRLPGRRRTLSTLPEVLAALPAEVALNLELKRQTADPQRLAERLAAAVVGRPRLLISSFDWPLLGIVRDLLPGAALAPLGGRHADPAALVDQAAALDAWSIHCRRSLASVRLVAAAGERPVLAYTVNEPDVARRLFDRGVRGVFTDFPGRLRSGLETRS
jgi:glycerophosphoryl diester phosphodiesterase